MILNIGQFVCLVCSRSKYTVFEINLFSLSIADFLSALSFLCFGAFGLYGISLGSSEKDDSDNGDLLGTVYDICIVLSLLHVIFIAVQRVLATKFPFKFRIVFTKKKCGFCLLALWVLSILYSAFVYHSNYGAVVVFICDALMLILYAILCYLIKRSSRNIAPRNDSSSKERRNSRGIFWYSFGVTVAFIVTTSPIALGFFLEQTPVLHALTDTLLPVTAVLDPLVYFFFRRCRKEAPAPRRVHRFQREVMETKL